jgi:uncharacterized protein YdaU (DUF1376 family)
MAQFPAFPLWTDAYLADTGHLTTIEHGAYLLLLVTMWRNGGELPNDDKELARYARMTSGQWLRIKPRLMRFFTVSSDSITQGRLTDELVAVKQKSAKQSDNARAKWRKNRDKRHADAYAETTVSDIPEASHSDASQTLNLKEEDKSSSILSETSSDQRPEKPKKAKPKKQYSEAFESFWTSYPRTPTMSKSEAFREWQKLDELERVSCAGAVTAYAVYLKTKPDLETVHACRFISQRRFEGFKSEPAAQVEEAVWDRRLNYARKSSLWDAIKWGPVPGSKGCMVPSNLLQPEDGAGWRESGRAA